jgi:hypothetical protein
VGRPESGRPDRARGFSDPQAGQRTELALKPGVVSTHLRRVPAQGYWAGARVTAWRQSQPAWQLQRSRSLALAFGCSTAVRCADGWRKCRRQRTPPSGGLREAAVWARQDATRRR